jgi:hypothetical protein
MPDEAPVITTTESGRQCFWLRQKASFCTCSAMLLA